MKAERIQTPAMRTLCNMLSGSDEATQLVIDGGFLSVLPHALKAAKARTRKEACWAISNIAAGTAAQVEALMAMRELLAEVSPPLETDPPSGQTPQPPKHIPRFNRPPTPSRAE